MTRTLLDPCFTQRERRWGRYLEAAMWLLGTTLLVALVNWSTGSPAFG